MFTDSQEAGLLFLGVPQIAHRNGVETYNSKTSGKAGRIQHNEVNK